ncbi:MAG: prepilin-type N-terminal cleavage/methylation domain-containing protein [Kiritimatiellales bacterium]|nr:prepilin-type N-terminal cleavage/methylation domain-containing protein [Kiritimatiellota bacterium]MBL7011991.1 prepilin-type N-terminal cleavage/methylation domain-containing protein [Kiritimatiellales bacterium]
MKRRGFTLLEIMIAIVILLIALTVAWQTLSTTTRAWTSARELMDSTHHGDFVMTQLAASLRSMAFFDSRSGKYGFRMDNVSGEYGEHSISWVTASGAFIPRGEFAEHGLHRIEVGAGRDDDGNEGLLVTIWPHLADEDDVEKKSWAISENIKGLTCNVYNLEDEDWDNEWENTNAIPGLIEITLYADPLEQGDDPIEYRQLIEIPLGPPVTNKVDSPL